MNRIESKWMLLRTLVKFRRRPYDELRTMVGDSQQIECADASGTRYQIDIDIVWDSNPGGDIRILGSIDDGGWRAFCPLTYDELKTPPRVRH
jgi:hypothetical protein